MRIVSWNCFRGECRERAAQLDSLRPDVVFLQECGEPAAPQDDTCRWFGNVPIQGVGVVTSSGWRVEAAPRSPEVPDSVYPVQLLGGEVIHALGVWTQQRPTHVRAAANALDAYRYFMTGDHPVIMVGDFNSHWRWDSSSSVNHSHFVGRLRDEFGLVSAYHAFYGVEPGEEQPTLYWQWRQHQPYHVDYCFIPESWLPGLRSVSVGTWEDWEGLSDHRPLVVDVDESPSS